MSNYLSYLIPSKDAIGAWNLSLKQCLMTKFYIYAS